MWQASLCVYFFSGGSRCGCCEGWTSAVLRLGAGCLEVWGTGVWDFTQKWNKFWTLFQAACSRCPAWAGVGPEGPFPPQPFCIWLLILSDSTQGLWKQDISIVQPLPALSNYLKQILPLGSNSPRVKCSLGLVGPALTQVILPGFLYFAMASHPSSSFI